VTTTDASPPFGRFGARLRQLLDAGASIEIVEHAIESFALGRDEESALWLWARSRHDPLPGDAGDEPIDGWPSAGQLLTDRLVALIG